jgi:hypothetical protein
MRSQGLWKPLSVGSRRREWKAVHGFRKFFKTQAERVMKSINVETCMGHNIGVSNSYYKPTVKEVLEDYLKTVDLLTINDEDRLSKHIQQLTETGREHQYNINAKLQEKDDQIRTMIRKQEQFEKLIQSLIDSGQFKAESS